MSVMPMITNVLVLSKNTVRHILLQVCKTCDKEITIIQERNNNVNTTIGIRTTIEGEFTRNEVGHIKSVSIRILWMLGVKEFVGRIHRDLGDINALSTADAEVGGAMGLNHAIGAKVRK